MSSVAGAAAAGRDLITCADGLARAFEALAAADDDASHRVALSRIADRLNASVVRPLAALVGRMPHVNQCRTRPLSHVRRRSGW